MKRKANRETADGEEEVIIKWGVVEGWGSVRLGRAESGREV